MITPNSKIQREWSPTEKPTIRFIDCFSNDAMGRMRRHFQDFGFIYVLALIGLILIVALLKFTCVVHDKSHVQATISHLTDSLTRRQRPRLSVTFAPADVMSPIQAPVSYQSSASHALWECRCTVIVILV
jgi:hypothetical protein